MGSGLWRPQISPGPGRQEGGSSRGVEWLVLGCEAGKFAEDEGKMIV